MTRPRAPQRPSGPRRPAPRDRRPPKRSKPRSPLWAKVSTILGAIVMVVAGAGVAVPKLLASWATAEIPRIDAIPDDLKGADIDGPINFLLLGIDVRFGGEDDGHLSTDSIMILHVTAAHDQAYLISIPRDSLVDIPPYPATGFGGWTTKINAAFFTGARDANGARDLSKAGLERGTEQVMRTISNLVPGGMKFHGAAIIYFDGFLKVLEALGGVDMCVDLETYSIHYWSNGERAWVDLDQYQPNGILYPPNVGYHYPLGCRPMQAWEALDYSRQRHFPNDNGDYARQRHQQQLIKAIVSKIGSVSTLTDLGKIASLQTAAGDLLSLDLGDHGVEDWAFNLKSIRPGDLTMIRTNGGQYATVFLEDGSEAQQLTDDSIKLLQSVANDTVFDFLATHSDWIASDGSQAGT